MKPPVSGPSRIRQVNRSAVLNHIRHNGKNSRSNIGKELGLSAAAMTSVVNELLAENLLRKTKKNAKTTVANKTQGRPISYLELNPNKAAVFGILLRPTENSCLIESAWADYTGALHTSKKIIEVATDEYQSILEGIHQAVEQLEKNKTSKSKIYGLCIGIPGVVEKQKIPIAPKLPCIATPMFTAALKATFEFPVSVENDVNLSAMSELHRQPRLRDISFAYLHVYSGIGSSIVLQGKLLRGSRGWAGEIGQLDIHNPDDKRPNFEQLLSTSVLTELLESLGEPSHDLDVLVEYIDRKDPKVIAAIEAYSRHLFDAINTLHRVLDLDEVIIDFKPDALLDKILPHVARFINKLPNYVIVSVPSSTQQASLNGAALNALNLALEKIEARQK